MPTPKKLNAMICYEKRIKGFTLKEIAEENHVSIEAVRKAVERITGADTYKLAILSVETFLQEFSRAQQFFDIQVNNYEKLIEEVQQMTGANDKEKRAKIDLIRKLMESQGKSMENIIANAKQGEVILAIQLVREVLKKHAPAKPLIISKVEPKALTDEPADSS